MLIEANKTYTKQQRTTLSDSCLQHFLDTRSEEECFATEKLEAILIQNAKSFSSFSQDFVYVHIYKASNSQGIYLAAVKESKDSLLSGVYAFVQVDPRKKAIDDTVFVTPSYYQEVFNENGHGLLLSESLDSRVRVYIKECEQVLYDSILKWLSQE